MTRERLLSPLSDFVYYLIKNQADDRVPPLANLSRELGVGVASLREQLEVARAMGMVEVRPKTGIKKLPYSFAPAAKQSILYAVEIDPVYFQYFLELRDHIEAAYWHEAVGKLTIEDYAYLNELITRAREKLLGQPIQNPHYEHKELHLAIYRRINNPFVIGLLEAFWDLYETKGLSVYGDLDYLEKVWSHHEKMVSLIVSGEIDAAYQVMIEHKGFLYMRSKPVSHQFE